jgi:hypothetical protein
VVVEGGEVVHEIREGEAAVFVNVQGLEGSSEVFFFVFTCISVLD